VCFLFLYEYEALHGQGLLALTNVALYHLKEAGRVMCWAGTRAIFYGNGSASMSRST
jgi:hypothetical protein